MKKFMPPGSETLGEPWVVVEGSQEKVVLDCFLPGYLLVDSHRDMAGEWKPFQRVIVPSTGSLCETGKPQLPTLGRYLRIPPDCDYEVSTETGQETVHGPILVWPAQMETDKQHLFELDGQLYASDTPYPEEIVRVRGPYSIEGIPSLLVHVTPFQYIPAEEQLLAFGRIKVAIALRPRQAVLPPVSMSGSGERGTFGRLFFHRSGGAEDRPDVPAPHEFTQGSGVEFLIVYSDPFRDAAEKLAKWKNSRGLVTQTASKNESGYTVDALKTFIRSKKACTPSRLGYVLLLGDTNSIPAETIIDERYDDNKSDYYYSTEVDPEPGNNDDYIFPWLAIGRIPASDPAEAMAIVDKIIAYEKDPPSDPDYYKRVLFAAFFEDIPAQDQHEDKGCIATVERIRTSLELLGYEGKRVYVTNNTKSQLYYQDSEPVPSHVRQEMFSVLDPGSKAAATQALIAATSQGQLILCHRGHGSWNGWSSPPFEQMHLNQVAGDVPSVFYSIDCETGSFDHLPQCFAESILKLSGGAVSLIAATRESNCSLNNLLIKGLFDATFPKVLPDYQGNQGEASPIRRLGDILNYGKSYLPVDACTKAMLYIKDHFEIYHVIGDPTLEIWTEFPKTLTLEVKLEADTLEILLSTCPVGCVLSIWFEEQLLKRLEPSSARVEVPADHLPVSPGEEPSNLRVCCWAPGHRYCEVKLESG